MAEEPIREDSRFYPLLVALAGCLCNEVESAGLRTCFCGLVGGNSIDISRVNPEVGGMGWVRLTGINPVLSQSTGTVNLCALQLSLQIEVGYADCYPINEYGEPLSMEEELDAVRRQQAGAEAVYRALFCCDWVSNAKRRLVPGTWVPGGPEGGIIWSIWSATLEVP